MRARLGRYEVLKHLASGGMADVLLGRTEGIEGFERHVVLKRIKPVHAQDLRFIRMFLDEARLAANLHHQHIVQVHDIGEAAGEYFIAMEYLHGEDVRTILSTASRSRQHVPLGYAMAIVSAAAAGLHYAHERRGPDKRLLGIVHRDVSPSNILVGYDGSIKIVDFGIAKASARQETRSGSLKGKVSYMSPEQCKSAESDRRSDVYSLGVVLYELSTTSRLFKGANDYLVMDQIVNGRVPLPRVRRPDLPSELSAIIMRAIATDPERRFSTADELRRAIDHVADRLGLTASSSAIAAYMRQQFGDKPEPWLELGGQVVASLDGLGDGSRPHGGWTELWRSDGLSRSSGPSRGGGSPSAGGAPRGSGPVPRPSGTGVGDDAPRSAGEPSVRRSDPRASTALTDAKMGWESQRPARAGRAIPAWTAAIAVPLVASIGLGIWWFAGREAPAVGGIATPAAVAPHAPVPMPGPSPAHAPMATPPPAIAAAPAAVAASEPLAVTAAHGTETAAGSAKRSHRGAAKVEAAAVREPSSREPASPPAETAPAPATAGSSAAPAGAPVAAPADPLPPPGTLAPLPGPSASSPAGSGSRIAAGAIVSLSPAAPAPQSASAPADTTPALLSHAVVERIASQHARELSRCDGGEPLRGEVTVRFSVEPTGKVSKAQLATTLGKPKVATCILRSVQNWQFPPPGDAGALGTYTLSFQ
ncbi:MAG TPA: protein kinase [Kofleriaceae bacterium]|nr:protein kinase [Kofleriaceae bacterium]